MPNCVLCAPWQHHPHSSPLPPSFLANPSACQKGWAWACHIKRARLYASSSTRIHRCLTEPHRTEPNRTSTWISIWTQRRPTRRRTPKPGKATHLPRCSSALPRPRRRPRMRSCNLNVINYGYLNSFRCLCASIRRCGSACMCVCVAVCIFYLCVSVFVLGIGSMEMKRMSYEPRCVYAAYSPARAHT